MRPKSSLVWHYFVSVDVSNAKCKLCHRVYSRKGRTTTPLKCHLRAMHPKIFTEFEKLDEEKKMSSDIKKKKLEDGVEESESSKDVLRCNGERGGPSLVFIDGHKTKFAKRKSYHESEKLEPQLEELNEQKESYNDPLTIKTERNQNDEVSVDFEDTELRKEYFSSDEFFSRCNKNAVKCKQNRSTNESNNSSIEELVEVKCDRIDLMFLGYASAVKQMSRRKQITIKHDIAKIIMEAELSELE